MSVPPKKTDQLHLAEHGLEGHSVHIAVWDILLPEESVVVSERWGQICGIDFPATPVPFSTLCECIHEEDRALLKDRWGMFIKEADLNLSLETSFRVIHPSAGERLIELQGHVVSHHENGELARIIATVSDVTERMRVKGQEAQRLRAQRLDALGTLARGISHDFNNALATIIGYNELLQGNPREIHNVLKCSEYINRASQRAQEIIRQILLINPREKPKIKPIDLVDVVKESVALISAEGSVKTGIDCHYELAHAMVEVDAEQISEAITNLLKNATFAVKESGGQVDVRIGECFDSNVAEPNFFVEIKDNGQGIPAIIQERIFEPFFSTKTKGERVGLGLATAQGIVESHGGRILLKSEEGHGASFTIFMPQLLNGVPLEKEGAEPQSASTSSLKILLVDDEIALADVTTQLLMIHGFQVDAHHDPILALEHCQVTGEIYDLAICDFNMPRMCGTELIDALQKLHPKMPCLLVSGQIETRQRLIAEANPSVQILQKPYSHEELLAAIINCTPGYFIPSKS